MNTTRFTTLDDIHTAICEQWNTDGTCCHNCIDCTAIDEAREIVVVRTAKKKEAG